MQTLIQYFVLLPLIGFIISNLLPRKNENLISKTSIYIVGAHFISAFVFVVYWLINGHPTIDLKTTMFLKSITGCPFNNQ